MPTPKQIAEDLWQRFWAAGVTDPIVAIEQIGYLILLRTLDLRAARSPDGTASEAFSRHPLLVWSRLRGMSDKAALAQLEKDLIPFLVAAAGSESFARALADSSFRPPQPKLARDCMAAIEDLDLPNNRQAAGEVFDELLDQLLLAGGRSGQVRTPPYLAEAMVDIVEPEPHQVVCDPAVGTGTFLVEASRQLEGGPGGLLGFDVAPDLVRIALINLLMHEAPNPRITCADTLSRGFKWPTVDVVVTNPPFAGNLDRREVHPGLELDTSRSDVLFLELCRRLLRPRGKAVLLVPEGVLFGRQRAYVEARRRWLTQGKVEAAVSLAPQVLGSNTTVQTAILVLRASGRTERVWFGRAQPADLGRLAAALRWRFGRDPRPSPPARELGEHLWSATLDEIGESGWSLAPSTYSPREVTFPEDEEPLELLRQAQALAVGIEEELASAESLLEDRP